MRIVRLNISNFRGVKSASLLFDDHTLFVGANNVGKSTICEALLLIRSESELGAAIDAHNGFVLKRHNVLQGKLRRKYNDGRLRDRRLANLELGTRQPTGVDNDTRIRCEMAINMKSTSEFHG